MQHYFIINPIAGRHDSSLSLEEKLERIFKDKDEPFFVYITKGPNDATLFIKKTCIENESLLAPHELTFYICGGDGTCFEAVNGLYGYPHARMTIIPVGSCNDFLKSLSEYDFSDIASLIDGKEILVDLLKVNDRFTLNVANVGYDAKVNYDCVRFRDKYKTVKSSYNHAIVRNLLKKLGDKVRIYLDDGEIIDKNALLMAFANGKYYGGGYKCAPKALINDGLLDVVIVKKVSIFTFARLIKFYKRGEHLDNPKLSKIITYRKAKRVIIESDDLLCLCLDGETFHMNKIEIEIIKSAIRFVVPSK